MPVAPPSARRILCCMSPVVHRGSCQCDERGEQECICRHLQAELDGFLNPDGQQADSRSRAHPIGVRIIVRGQVSFEEIRTGRMGVVVTELPYQVNKTTLI